MPQTTSTERWGKCGTSTVDLDKADRVTQAFEEPWRERHELGVHLLLGVRTEFLDDHELPSGTVRCHPGGEVDTAADVVAFAVQDRAVVRAYVQGRELWLGFGELIDGQSKFDRVRDAVKASMNASPICLMIRPPCSVAAPRTRALNRRSRSSLLARRHARLWK